MKKEDFLKQIANEGYNVGIGCNKSFATYDFLDKFPEFFNIVVLIISVLQLMHENFPYVKGVNIVLLCISISSIYLRDYNSTKQKFCDSGIELTKIEKEIKNLYFKINNEFKEEKKNEYEKEIKSLLERAQKHTMHSHIMIITDILAHYKLFFQKKSNSKWFCDELGLKLIKDKIPENLKIIIVIVIIGIVIHSFCKFFF